MTTNKTIRLSALGLQFCGGQKVGDFVCYAVKTHDDQFDTEMALASGDDYEQCYDAAQSALDVIDINGDGETLREQGFELHFYEVVED